MIRFDEKTHRYFDGDRELISVTSLMRKHGLAPDYTAVRSDVLQAKAERGSLIHKEIETYIKTGEIGFTKEVAEFARYLKANELKAVASEMIVYNDICAGTLDLILETKDEKIIVADIKTTATLHREAVSWQLSIYDALNDYAADVLQAFHFDGDGNLKVVDITFKQAGEVERLFEAERNGETYAPPPVPIAEKQLAQLAKFEKIIAEAEATKKAAEEQRDEIKAAIMLSMEKNGVKTFESDRIKLTYVAPSTRATIDTARLKKDLPEVAEQYTKTSETKASLRITIKD